MVTVFLLKLVLLYEKRLFLVAIYLDFQRIAFSFGSAFPVHSLTFEEDEFSYQCPKTFGINVQVKGVLPTLGSLLHLLETHTSSVECMSPPRFGGRSHRCPKHTDTQWEDTAGVHLPPPHHPSVSIPEAPYATEARLSLCHLAINQCPKKPKIIMKTTCKSSPQFLQCL